MEWIIKKNSLIFNWKIGFKVFYSNFIMFKRVKIEVFVMMFMEFYVWVLKYKWILVI